MPLASRRVTDAAALKALAHPVRMALLAALVARGPLTASQAATVVDASPSNCSWHLRRLAEHGFVREARGGTGRDRPWQAVSEGLGWGDVAPVAHDQAGWLAADALTDVLVDREVQRLRAARAARDREPSAWRDTAAIGHAQLWLTADEAAELSAELREVVRRRGDRVDRADQQGRRFEDTRRLVSLVGWLVPSGPAALSPGLDGPPAAGRSPGR
jgi:DNA-binding transcriptional ArsR family regulator